MCGKLIMIVGPMFSGKTSSLINYYNIYSLKHRCLLINNSLDKRYSKEGNIASHNKIIIDSNSLDDIREIYKLEAYKASEVIFIDEGHFFKDLSETIKDIIKTKIVIISCLLGDYKKQMFSNISDLLPEADEVEFKKSICSICKTMNYASFTKKTVIDDDRISVGSHDKYIAVCREHYD